MTANSNRHQNSDVSTAVTHFLIAALCCLGFGFSTTADAADILDADVNRHGGAMKQAFAELIPAVEHFAVEVEIDGETTVLGTLIDRQNGWVVAKASELGEFPDAADRFRCQLSNKTWLPAQFLGFQRELDLVFLKIDPVATEELPAIKRAGSKTPGQWVISVGFDEPLPLGVGVLGAVARDIENGQGYAGLKALETSEGLKVTLVYANSGAAQAGLKKGDLLLKQDEEPVQKRAWLSKRLNEFEPGDWCPLIALRDGEILQLDLRLGVSWENMVDRQAMMNRFGSDVSQRRTGFPSVFQHDTLMHPRNCGGPCVNLKGDLIGVNIARAGRTDTYAIPIADVLKAAKEFND